VWSDDVVGTESEKREEEKCMVRFPRKGRRRKEKNPSPRKIKEGQNLLIGGSGKS